MKILITTGLSRSDVGGPSSYAPNLSREFSSFGHSVRVYSYGAVERKLPVGIRHLYFFFKILPDCFWADWIITLDTFSVGVPSVWAARLLNKKILVRIGGDFLWESYVNRTGESVSLREFYTQKLNFNWKEKIIFRLTKLLTRRANVLVFNTEWFKDIWLAPYDIPSDKARVVRHPTPPKSSSHKSENKNFVWAGRINKVKNLDLLKQARDKISKKYENFSLELIYNKSHEEVLEAIKGAYALVLPSLSDTCPLFIIEGVSFNKPFIVTKETGLREMYNKGGIFVDPKKSEYIEEAIEEMLKSEVYDKFVEELKSGDLRRSWQDVAKEILSLMK